MTLSLLNELLSSKAISTATSKPFIDKICKLLFKTEGAASGQHYGVVNKQSTLVTPKGDYLMLTFDNSNSQQEYELNSLTPLGIERDSETVKELTKMYDEHQVKSKAKLKFVSKGGKTLLRGVNFGSVIDERALRMIQDMLVMLSHDFKRGV